MNISPFDAGKRTLERAVWIYVVLVALPLGGGFLIGGLVGFDLGAVFYGVLLTMLPVWMLRGSNAARYVGGSLALMAALVALPMGVVFFLERWHAAAVLSLLLFPAYCRLTRVLLLDKSVQRYIASLRGECGLRADHWGMEESFPVIRNSGS